MADRDEDWMIRKIENERLENGKLREQITRLTAEVDSWRKMHSDSYLAQVQADYKAERESGEKLAAEVAQKDAEFERLLSVARGCHDYNGGHLSEPGYSTYHHGIQTVINALEAVVKDHKNMQVRVLESIGNDAALEEQA